MEIKKDEALTLNPNLTLSTQKICVDTRDILPCCRLQYIEVSPRLTASRDSALLPSLEGEMWCCVVVGYNNSL